MGMRQKLGVAVAFAKDAKSPLLDAPVSWLDKQAANELSRLLKTVS
jgi:ABC-2 type transport system ATP-binding protein